MASVAKFIIDPVELEEEIKRRDDLAESTRRLYFIAARRIQAWIRGILTRNHFRLLHESAITIQRHWRGYRARIAADRYLADRVRQMWQDYYDEMATRVQATWRGYWTRRTVLDIRKMRRWLQQVYKKNEEVVKDMERFRQEHIRHVQMMLEGESAQWTLFILFKIHHMLRTKRTPGTITRIDDTQFTFIEEMIKCLGYRHYARDKRRMPKRKCRDCRIDAKPTLILRGTRYERCERHVRDFESNVRAGVVPIFRSEPYEEREKEIRKWNQIKLNAAAHEPLGTGKNVEPSELSELIEEFEGQARCIPASKLYERIEKMDCHLKNFRFNCPVHDPPCSTSRPSPDCGKSRNK